MRRVKVLIVEDEMDLLELVDFNLTRRGFVTDWALDGAEALKKVETFSPDIIILDLMLPQVDGWEISRRLRQEGRDVPIIMLTAKCMPEDRVKGFESGADDYVTKPFSVKELVIRIEKLIEKKRNRYLQTILTHEMNNKLNAIGSYSYLLAKDGNKLSSEHRESYLRNIGSLAAYSTEFMSEVGMLVDMASGELRFTQARCDIRGIIKEVVECYRSIALLKNITISVSAGDDVPEVSADPFALKQAFTNLIGNAVKYGRENGFVVVSIAANESGVVVRVNDDGCGIPAESIPHIFEYGYRARNVEGSVNGSGLGLYLVRTLLDRVGGAIAVESVEGEGSSFAVSLKVLEPGGEAA